MTDKLAFVAFSDPHIGRRWGAHTVGNTRDTLADRYYDPIRELINNYPDTPKVCGGDFYDRAHNDESTLQATIPLLREMGLVIAGNHDHVNRSNAVTSMALQKDLISSSSLGAAANPIEMLTDHLNSATYGRRELGGVEIFSVPHVGTQQQFEVSCIQAGHNAARVDGPTVLVIHANFGTPGEGKPDSNLYLTPVLRKALEDQFDFILVGHEHLFKQVGKTIVMGSTQPCNFGELGPRFFYEFWLTDDGLQVKKVPIKTQLSSATVLLSADMVVTAKDVQGELVDLKGVVPVAKAREVQKLVKELYMGGALAVRMGVTFDNGTAVEGGAVSGQMTNLIEVVRGEIAENLPWTKLLEEVLTELSEEQQ